MKILDYTIAVLCLLILASIASADPITFVVVANNSQRFEVAKSHLCPAGICKGACNCIDQCRCSPGFCPESVPLPMPQKIVTTYRQPHGHTHTCPRCGTTWDHASNPGHSCPKCGTMQFNQDSRPKLIAVTTTVPAVAPAATVPSKVQFGTVTVDYSGFGGCANGSCGTPQRVGILRRR